MKRLTRMYWSPDEETAHLTLTKVADLAQDDAETA